MEKRPGGRCWDYETGISVGDGVFGRFEPSTGICSRERGMLVIAKIPRDSCRFGIGQ